MTPFSTSMADMSVTVTIHRTQKKVLWVETDKNFVDSLFGLLSTPMGQVLNLSNDHQYSTSGLRKLYQSFHAMEKDFMVCNKEDILKPKDHLSTIFSNLLKIENNNSSMASSTQYTPLDLYTCPYNSICRTFSSYAYQCPSCWHVMDTPVEHYVPNPISQAAAYLNGSSGKGFVKGGGMKYIVTDDLSVTSKVSFSSLAYLKTMHIADLNQLEEKVVSVSAEKCKELMKMVLTSNHMVLTNWFKEEVFGHFHASGFSCIF